eukprot:scaffold4917_cov120-Cylindrotheca_fusiformis.AAC.2
MFLILYLLYQAPGHPFGNISSKTNNMTFFHVLPKRHFSRAGLQIERGSKFLNNQSLNIETSYSSLQQNDWFSFPRKE